MSQRHRWLRSFVLLTSVCGGAALAGCARVHLADTAQKSFREVMAAQLTGASPRDPAPLTALEALRMTAASEDSEGPGDDPPRRTSTRSVTGKRGTPKLSLSSF